MILCCGEALIDMMPGRAEDGSSCFVPCVGGSVFNAAVALGRLGTSTGFLGGISSDFFGSLFRKTLTESGVSAEHIVISDRPTTLAFVRLVDGEPAYAFYDENTAGRMLSPEMLPDIPDTVSTLFFGSISLISEPCGSFFETLASRESKRRVIMFDPNIRAGFVDDEEAYRARVDRIFGLSDILKLSNEDLAWLAGGSGSTEINSILKRGPRLVVVTSGGEGASAHTRNLTVEVAAKKVEVIDTVGAGDAFSAGILAAISSRGLLRKDRLDDLSEEDLASLLELGSMVSAVTVSRTGANPPYRHEIPALAFATEFS